MGKYFRNPFSKPDLEAVLVILILTTVLPLAILKLLTLGAFQMEVFYDDLGDWLSDKGFKL